jgi:hypothetical protein
VRNSHLREEARSFASDLSTVLNGTVCDGVRISAVLAHDTAWVGLGVSKRSLVGKPFHFWRCRRASLYALLSFRLSADGLGEHMMVRSSVIVLGVGDPAEDRTLLHIDYEREKSDGYPEAHLQVHGDSADWRAALRSNQPLSKLHLPAGGRRYRTTVEDFVEFLIVEEFVEGRPGWPEVVAQHRRAFEERQLRAAIRRNPEVAREAVDKLPQ